MVETADETETQTQNKELETIAHNFVPLPQTQILCHPLFVSSKQSNPMKQTVLLLCDLMRWNDAQAYRLLGFWLSYLHWGWDWATATNPVFVIHKLDYVER